MSSSALDYEPADPVRAVWTRRAIRRFLFMLAGVTALFIATEITGWLALVPHVRPVSFYDISGNILFAIGFGCPVILYLSSLPRPSGLLLIAALGTAIAAALRLLHGQIGVPQIVTGLGLASIATLALRAVLRPGPARTDALLFLLPACVAVVFTFEAGVFFETISSVFPLTYDALAYRADAAYGFHPSFAAGRLFAAAPIVKYVCQAIYLAPPPALVFVYALQVRSRQRPPPSVDAVTLLLALFVGYVAYFVFPVCGPAFAFGPAFPLSPPAVSAVPCPRMPVGHFPRNGMPSLHMASVLVAYWQAKPYGRRARAAAAVFVIGTFFATLGLGEHYLVDLVVAMPFTLAVMAACTPARHGVNGAKWAALLVAGSLWAGWCLLLRWGTLVLLAAPPAMWAATLVTVATIVLLERRLARATDAAAASAA